MTAEKRKTGKEHREDIRRELFFDLTQEDSAPNAFVVHCIWYCIAVTLLFVVLELIGVCIVDIGIAMKGLVSAIVIMLIAEAFGYLTNREKPWLKYLLVLLSVLATTVLSIFLTYHTILVALIPLLIAAQYPRRRILWFAYILSLLSIPLAVILGYQYGLCDADMAIETISKASTYGGALPSRVPSLAEQWKTLLLFFALPRVLIITALVPMINSIVINKKDFIQRDIRIKYLSEHDNMTRFYNREKYSYMLETVYPQLQNVVVIFFDVNDLKFVNDFYGHDVGDEMISRASKSIGSSLKDNMDAYRFGGDEFIVVIRDGEDQDAEALIEDWKLKLDKINSLPDFIGCRIAYGYAAGKGADFQEVLRQADKNMYCNKMQSKVESGEVT